MKLITAVLYLFLGLPISFYLQYSILQAIHADRLLMFLFWVNVPILVLVTFIFKLLEKDSDR